MSPTGTLPDPSTASARTDLPWLRRRHRPSPPASTAASGAGSTTARPSAGGTAAGASASGATSPAASSGGRINYVRPDRAARSVTPSSPPATNTSAPSRSAARDDAAGSSGGGIDLSRPARSDAPAGGGLDLSRPAPDRTGSAGSGSAGAGLDLSRPASDGPGSAGSGSGINYRRPSSAAGNSLDLGSDDQPPPSTPPSAGASSSSLDLSTPAPGSPPPAATSSTSGPARSGTSTARRPAKNQDRHHVTRRTRQGATTLLDFSRPVVTLDRLQSGIGALRIEAAVGADVGDFRLGAAYALTGGRSGTIDRDAGRRQAPDGRRPVVLALREQFEEIAVDLRQIHELERLLVFGYSASRSELRWGGTMVIETYGGDRIDAPIVSAPSPAVLALVTVFVIDGECVVRAEMDPVGGSVRETCQAFGYDRITWLDDRQPVT